MKHLTSLLPVPVRSALLAFGAALGLLAACSSGDGEGSSSGSNGRICSPGTNVVCKCRNGETGTKPCNDEGTGYSAECSVDGTGLCPGGEVSSSGGGSSSGNPSGPSETCPGERVAVSAAAPTEFTGSTASANDDAKGEGDCSVGDGAADQVFQVVPSTRGTLKVEVVPIDGDYAPVAYLRRGGCDGAQVGCMVAAAGEVKSFEVKVVKDEPYWLVVDGVAGPGSSGQYRVRLTLTEGAFCGDGVADLGEACDDGNNVDGDGCSADCSGFSGNPSSAVSCPGQPIHLWFTLPDNDPRRTAEGTGSTSPSKLVGAQNNFSYLTQNCLFGDATTNTSTEHVYDLIAHGDGPLAIELSQATYDARMSVWSACTPSADANLEDCASEDDGGALFLPSGGGDLYLRDGEHYTVVVDGNASTGDYKLVVVY